jgi:hypothetical protein
MAKTEHLDKAMKRKLEATSTRDLEWGIKTGSRVFYGHVHCRSDYLLADRDR